MNISFFKKTVFENQELEKKHKKFLKYTLIFAVPCLILLIIDTVTSHEQIIGIYGLFGIVFMLPFFFLWGAIIALELADKITGK